MKDVSARAHTGKESGPVADVAITEEELAGLIRRIEEATTAFLRGDMEHYIALTPHISGFTLMNPFGGAPASYSDRPESLRASAGNFRGGEVTLEVTEAHAWGDTLVLVMIERQHGQVGGLPDQEWSLRVTQVYRRVGADWQVVHRHADPLVRGRSLEEAAALARG